MTTSADALLHKFDRAVRESFAFLITEYGFQSVEAIVHIPELWVVFRSSTVQITVTFEFGSGLWTTLSELQNLHGRIAEGRGYDLAFLLHVLASPELACNHMIDFDEEKIKLALSEQAASLREYGRDVLRGDFRIFPELDRLATENLRRREETLFRNTKG